MAGALWNNRLLARILGAFVVGFIIVVSFFRWTSPSNVELPSLYEDYVESERNFQPSANQQDERYIYFANHVYGEGYGNVLQEMVMHAHLAYLSKRSFVFYNYTWTRDPSPYSQFGSNLIPSRIPMSATLSGPLVGSSAPGDAPQAVSVEYFRKVCPEPTILKGDEFGGRNVLDYWTKRLGESKDKCIEIHKDSRPIFDYFFFGTKEALESWPSLSTSPILQTWGWSQLILSAWQSNRHLFEKPHELVVLHLRRGDFEHHCYFLAKTSSSFSGFNSFPSIPDTFSPPPKPEAYDQPMMNTVVNAQVYLDRCYPTISLIVDKLKEVHNGEVKRLYVMTNGKKPWLEELEESIRSEMPGAWSAISTSRDLELTKEQRGVAQVLDMMVASDARGFVGNGFSSLTANIVMLRMARGLDGTRLW